MRRENGALHCACLRCAVDLGPIGANYRDACVLEERDIAAANPDIGDWRRYVDDRPVFRQFYCPGCGSLIENEVAREDDPVLRDIELHLKRRKEVIHELRVYHCVPGRLPDLNRRFETITLKIWEKHGIRPLGFWTTLVGPDNQALVYLLEWASLAERERIWNGFMADPGWIAARAETEKNGPIVARIENQILAPTSYSRIK